MLQPPYDAAIGPSLSQLDYPLQSRAERRYPPGAHPWALRNARQNETEEAKTAYFRDFAHRRIGFVEKAGGMAKTVFETIPHHAFSIDPAEKPGKVFLAHPGKPGNLGEGMVRLKFLRIHSRA